MRVLIVKLSSLGDVVHAMPAVQDVRAALAGVEIDWVVEGAPVARKCILSTSHDGDASTVLWDCTEGAFNWYFGYDETVHIVEGEVEITDAQGFHQVLRANDVAFFPAGSNSFWRVKGYVRKVAFCRTIMPAKVSAAIRFLRALKAKLKGGTAPQGLSPN